MDWHVRTSWSAWPWPHMLYGYVFGAGTAVPGMLPGRKAGRLMLHLATAVKLYLQVY